LSHSMTSADLLPRRYSLALLLLLLVGCGPTQVVVEGSFPPPLMTPLPVTLGVWYDEAFSQHEFADEAANPGDSSWVVSTGTAQVEMWNTLLQGMFHKLVPMQGAPGPDQPNPAVDGVLIPHVDELQYAIPAHTSVKVYEIWMRYRFELVSLDGEPIAEWSMTSYGKTPTAFLQSDRAAVNLAAVMALRDAGANFATGFTRVPAVNQWLEAHNVPPARGTP